MDRRLTPFSGRVALDTLRGRVEAERFTEGVPARLAVPLADLCATPGGARDRQLLLGARVAVIERRDGFAFVQAADDGYVGWVAAEALGAWVAPTHRVSAAATHVYPAPDIKTRARVRLSLGARVAVVGAQGAFLRSAEGDFVPAAHLRPLDRPEADPVAVAARLIGTPYLWGGNSRDGIDCSGLVQAALAACGLACPGDSDLQARALGEALPPGAALARGDLVFWPGHVGLMADPETLLHANAHHMAVAVEPFAAAAARIAEGGLPDWTARRLSRDAAGGGAGRGAGWSRPGASTAWAAAAFRGMRADCTAAGRLLGVVGPPVRAAGQGQPGCP